MRTSRCTSRRQKRVFLLKDFLVKKKKFHGLPFQCLTPFMLHRRLFSPNFRKNIFSLIRLTFPFGNCRQHLSLAFPVFCYNLGGVADECHGARSHRLSVSLFVYLSVSPYGFHMWCSKSQASRFCLRGEALPLGTLGSYIYYP